MNVVVKEAIEEASVILANEVGDNLFRGIYWAFVPTDSPDLAEYNTHYSNIVAAGFGNKEIMARFNNLLQKATIFTFRDITIKEYVKTLFQDDPEKAKSYADTISKTIQKKKKEELLACAKYLNYLFFNKKSVEATIGIFNMTDDRVFLREMSVEDGKYAGKVVREKFYAFGIDIMDISFLNKNYLNLFGFRIATVDVMDLYDNRCCIVKLSLEKIMTSDSYEEYVEEDIPTQHEEAEDYSEAVAEEEDGSREGEADSNVDADYKEDADYDFDLGDE